MTTTKQNAGTLIVLIVITALLYLNIYQYKQVNALQTRNDTQYQRLMEYMEEDEQAEEVVEEVVEEVEEEKSLYELQQESGEYAPFESGKLYIPIDTPDNI